MDEAKRLDTSRYDGGSDQDDERAIEDAEYAETYA